MWRVDSHGMRVDVLMFQHCASVVPGWNWTVHFRVLQDYTFTLSKPVKPKTITADEKPQFEMTDVYLPTDIEHICPRVCVPVALAIHWDGKTCLELSLKLHSDLKTLKTNRKFQTKHKQAMVALASGHGLVASFTCTGWVDGLVSGQK